jgi:hypothetical protein
VRIVYLFIYLALRLPGSLQIHYPRNDSPGVAAQTKARVNIPPGKAQIPTHNLRTLPRHFYPILVYYTHTGPPDPLFYNRIINIYLRTTQIL